MLTWSQSPKRWASTSAIDAVDPAHVLFLADPGCGQVIHRTVRELIRSEGPILRTLRARGLHHATLHLKKTKSTS